MRASSAIARARWAASGPTSRRKMGAKSDGGRSPSDITSAGIEAARPMPRPEPELDGPQPIFSPGTGACSTGAAGSSRLPAAAPGATEQRRPERAACGRR